MRLLLLIASVAVVFAADEEVEADVKIETKEEPKAEESAYVHQGYNDGLELMRHRSEYFDDERKRLLQGQSHYEDRQYPSTHDLHDKEHFGPVVLRTPGPLPHDGHIDIEAQNRIIADVFSPDYYQPTWVLDYRYLKTGGRDYTRGPGGQILILPKGVRSKEQKEFPDYDAYIEHLRLSRMKERQHHSHGDDRDHSQHKHDREHYNRDHGQASWYKH